MEEEIYKIISQFIFIKNMTIDIFYDVPNVIHGILASWTERVSMVVSCEFSGDAGF